MLNCSGVDFRSLLYLTPNDHMTIVDNKMIEAAVVTIGLVD